ncbi:hypothetical protein IF2G_04408 [Cordyceps javanica]|nr:hypothetical protein IF2G_04408 [Cordyceps javanica]
MRTTDKHPSSTVESKHRPCKDVTYYRPPAGGLHSFLVLSGRSCPGIGLVVCVRSVVQA